MPPAAALANGRDARSSSADRSIPASTQPDEMIAVRHDGAKVSRPTRRAAILEFVSGDHPDRVDEPFASGSPWRARARIPR